MVRYVGRLEIRGMYGGVARDGSKTLLKLISDKKINNTDTFI